MRKAFILIIVLISLLACSCEDSNEITQEDQVEAIEPFAAKQTALPLPIKVDLNTNPLNVVSTFVYQPYVIFTEDYIEMSKNLGSNFEDTDVKTLNDTGDAFMLASAGGKETISMLTKLDGYGDNSFSNHGILLKFMPIDSEGLKFTLLGGTDVDIWFEAGKFPVARTNPFINSNPNVYTLKQNIWQYIFMTMDDESNFRCIIWEEGNAEDLNSFSKYMIHNEDQASEFAEQSLEFAIELESNETLLIEQYWIFGYEELAR